MLTEFIWICTESGVKVGVLSRLCLWHVCQQSSTTGWSRESSFFRERPWRTSEQHEPSTTVWQVRGERPSEAVRTLALDTASSFWWLSFYFMERLGYLKYFHIKTPYYSGRTIKRNHDIQFCVLCSSLVKRLEFGPAPPRGISQGSQSPQGGVKILLWEEPKAQTFPECP